MNETDRSIQRDDAAALISAGNTDVADPAQPWGHPIIRNDIKLFANYGASITDDIKFYGHANYAQKEVEGGFYFRNPNTRGAVFSNDGGKTLLVGNLRGLTAEMTAWEARGQEAETAGQDFTGIIGMKAQRFSFGMKFRLFGKDQTFKIYLTFRPNCGIINTITLSDSSSVIARLRVCRPT